MSRDIRELKLSKIPMGNGRQKYTILMQSEHYLSDKYIRVLKDGFVSMDMAQNILVVKTLRCSTSRKLTWLSFTIPVV